MVNIEKIRQDPKKFARSVARKGYVLDTDAVLSLDDTRRTLIQEIEALRAEANKIAERGKDITAVDRGRGKHLKSEIKVKEQELKGIESQLNERLFEIPNPPLDGVPDGKDEKDNKVLRGRGEKRQMGFPPKDHVELGRILDVIDFEAGAKVAGSQFYYLKNEAVFLELALIRYALDVLREKGFTLMATPDLARRQFYESTGYLPRGEEAQTYEVAGEDLGLIATAEVTLAAYHADEVLDRERLPLLYAGLSHCFRKEAGAYGKHSKGLYRVHQFTKVEMFAFTAPKNSPKMHKKLLRAEEEIFQGLGTPYRVVEMCAGDLGAQAAKKYDIEAWMPGRGEWGEVTSTSNTTDYQARNLNIRFKEGTAADFVHTLNGTAVATSRAIIAILENFQRKDGGVDMPKALLKYLPFTSIEPKD